MTLAGPNRMGAKPRWMGAGPSRMGGVLWRRALRMTFAAWLAGAVLAGPAVAPAMAQAKDPAFLTFGVGAFDFNDDDSTGLLSFEYLSNGRFWVFQPILGAFATFEGSFYAYAGLGLDLFFGRRLVVTPSLAAGLYAEGGGKDLGSVLEFRSSIQLAYRFDDRSRLGVQFYHLSNASIADKNPGANALLLTYSMPIGAPRY